MSAKRIYFDMNSKQYTFSDFTKKTVINVGDGRELGHVCDLIFNNFGQIVAIIVPGKKSLFKSLTSSDNLIIPFNRIVRIGSDVILTDFIGAMAGVCSAPQKQDSAYAQNVRQAGYAPESAYPPPYRETRPADGQAYSMTAEPMYSAADDYVPPISSTPPSPPTSSTPPSPPRSDDPLAHTYYHTD